MFVDKSRIYIKAGNGGDGAVSFHREKYVAAGGPNGGDGGNGGNVIFRTDPSKNTLIDFRYAQHYRAGNGAKGEGGFCRGKNGEDLVISVPKGTIIRDYDTGGILADMFYDDQEVIVAYGGKGGKGNARFATSTRRTPGFSQKGVITEEHSVILELKTIADVGLAGFPNVGKSTLLSRVSAAKPKIANYHFTTLSPNLGVVRYHDDSFVMADIPGLIEGAADGAGLGHEFLRHIERVRLVVHVVDISGMEGRDPVEDYFKINQELSTYSEKLASLPQIVVANKCDCVYDIEEVIARFERETGAKVIRISAITGEGIRDLVELIGKKLEDIPKVAPMEFEPFEYAKEDNNSYDISVDEDGAYVLTGGLIDMLVRNIVLDDLDSFRYFQKTLRDKGVIKALKDMGATDGDVIRIEDTEFDFVE